MRHSHAQTMVQLIATAEKQASAKLLPNPMLPAVGSVVRLKPEVEQEKTMHRGKYFNVTGNAGRFLILTWGEQKVFFLPDEVDVVTQ